MIIQVPDYTFDEDGARTDLHRPLVIPNELAHKALSVMNEIILREGMIQVDELGGFDPLFRLPLGIEPIGRVASTESWSAAWGGVAPDGVITERATIINLLDEFEAIYIEPAYNPSHNRALGVYTGDGYGIETRGTLIAGRDALQALLGSTTMPNNALAKDVDLFGRTLVIDTIQTPLTQLEAAIMGVLWDNRRREKGERTLYGGVHMQLDAIKQAIGQSTQSTVSLTRAISRLARKLDSASPSIKLLSSQGSRQIVVKTAA